MIRRLLIGLLVLGLLGCGCSESKGNSAFSPDNLTNSATCERGPAKYIQTDVCETEEVCTARLDGLEVVSVGCVKTAIKDLKLLRNLYVTRLLPPWKVETPGPDMDPSCLAIWGPDNKDFLVNTSLKARHVEKFANHETHTFEGIKDFCKPEFD